MNLSDPVSLSVNGVDLTEHLADPQIDPWTMNACGDCTLEQLTADHIYEHHQDRDDWFCLVQWYSLHLAIGLNAHCELAADELRSLKEGVFEDGSRFTREHCENIIAATRRWIDDHPDWLPHFTAEHELAIRSCFVPVGVRTESKGPRL